MEIKLMEIVSSGGWMAVAGIIIYMFLNLDKKVEALQLKMESIAKAIEQKKDRSDCQICQAGIHDEFKGLVDKVDNLSVESVTREEHYRDISGWRTEIRTLNDKIDNYVLRNADAS